MEAVLVEKDRAECDVGDYRNNAVVNEEFSLIEEQEAEELLSDLSSVSSNSHSDSDIEKDVESGEEQELVNLLRADRAGGFTNIPEPSKPKAESVSNSAEKKTRKRTSRTPLRKPVLATQSADYSPANKIARGDYKKGTSPKLSMQISLLSSAASAVSSSSSKASIFQQEKTRVFHKSPKGVDENRRRSLQDAELAAMMEELESSEYIESQPYRARDEALAVRETAISYTAETDLSIVHRMDKALLSSQQQNLATQWSSQALFNSQILTQIESVQHWNIYEQEEDCNVLMDETEFSPSSLVPQKVVKNEEILSEIEGKSDAQEEGVITQAETDKLNKSFSNCRDEDLVAMMEAVEASCGLLFTQECDEIPAIGSTGVSYSLDEPTSPGAFFGIDSEDKFFCQDAIQDGAEKENEEFIANEDCNLLNPSPYLAPYTASKVKTPGRYLYYPLLEQDHMDCLYEGSGDEVSVSNLDCPAGATVVLDENESEVDAASSESVLSNTEAAAEANLRSVKRLSFSGALPSSPLKDVDKVAANKVAAQRYLFPLENISHVSMERQRGFAYRSLLSAYNCASFVRTMKFSKVVAFELVFRRIPKKFLTFRSHNWSNYWWSALSWSCSPAISVTCCDNDDFICYKQQSEVAVHPVGNNKKKTTSAAKRHEYLQTLMQQSTKPSTRGMTDSPHVLVGIALNFGDENSYYLPLPVCHTLPLDASQSVDGSSIITGVTPIDKRRGSLSLVPRRCRVLICRYVGFPVQFQQSIALHRLLHVDRDSRLSISEAINIVEDNNISACDSNGLTSNPLLLVSRDWYSAAREGMSVQWRKGGSLEWKLLSNIMSNPSITKVAINMKEKLVALRERDIIVEGILDDPALAMTLLQTSYPTANLDALVANMMIPPVPLEDHSASINTSGLFTTGVKSKRDGLLVRRGKRIAAFRSIAVMRFTSAVYALISSKNVFTLYRNIEMPLLGCVVEAEVAGMGIDMAFFSRIQSELEDRQEVINYYFRTIMGDHFNPDSPKDIGALKKRLVDHLCELHVAQEERALQARRIRQKAYATNGTGSIRDTSCSSYVIQNSSLEEWGSDAVKKSDHSSWEFCQQNDNLLVKSESAVRQRFQKLVKAFHPVMQLVSEHRRHSIMLPICGTIMRFTLGERCKALYHTIGTDTGRLIITSPPLQQVC